MQKYSFVKESVDVERLQSEIGLDKVQYLTWTHPDTLDIYTSPSLTAEELGFVTEKVQNHDKNQLDPKEYVTNVIYSASDYGAEIIRQLGVRNLLSGKTDDQIDSFLENPEVLKIGMALISGSLKYAKRKLQNLEPSNGITQDDIDWCIAKIDAFLGV